MQNLSKNVDDKIFSANLTFISFCFVIGLTGFCYVLTVLPEVADPSTILRRTYITGGWKFASITTHTLTFTLIPLGMRIFYQGLKNLGLPLRVIFGSQLGLAFIMVAIASEIGWHVTPEALLNTAIGYISPGGNGYSDFQAVIKALTN